MFFNNFCKYKMQNPIEYDIFFCPEISRFLVSVFQTFRIRCLATLHALTNQLVCDKIVNNLQLTQQQHQCMQKVFAVSDGSCVCTSVCVYCQQRAKQQAVNRLVVSIIHFTSSSTSNQKHCKKKISYKSVYKDRPRWKTVWKSQWISLQR